MWLYLKDKFNIFNEVWCEFLVKVKDFLKLFKFIKRVNDFNVFWMLSFILGEVEGVLVKFEDSF